MKKLIAATIATAALLTGGCSTGDTIGATNTNSLNGNPGGGTAPAQKAANTALYQVNAGLLPYPFDVYFANSTDGTLNIQPANALEPNQTAVNALDGFSTTGSIRERFNGPIDAASLATPGAVVVVHISTNNLTKAPVSPLAGGTFVPLVGCVAQAPACATADYSVAPASDDPSILEITPLKPLAASTCLPPTAQSPCAAADGGNGEGYLVLLTRAITVGGVPTVPDSDYASFEAALSPPGGPTCPSITNASLNAICQLTGAHLALAGILGINPANIVASFSFSTESTIDTLAILSATTPPQALTLNATGLNTHQLNPALPGLADVFVGVLSIPYYLQAATPANPAPALTGSWTAAPFAHDPTSTFVTRFNPVPKPTQMLKIPVLATVPHGAALPVPVLIFQHGITRNREDMLAVADSFASKGFAVVAIDLPLHGLTVPFAAADPSTYFYASSASPLYAGLGLPANGSIERTFDLDVENNATGAAGPDGVIDPSGSHFINLTSLLTSRDNLREGAADLITLERSLATATVANLGNVKPFAAGKTHYLGHSLGAIVGGVFMGVVPASDVSTATLAVPGGKISQLLIDSPTFAPVINAGLEAQGLFPGTTLYAQFFRDAQTVVDSGDPINYIALAHAQHPLHLIQVVGGSASANGGTFAPDQVVPNSATQRLIVAGGLTQLHPPGAAGASPLDVFVNFTAGTHGSILDPTCGVKPPLVQEPLCGAATGEMQTEAIAFALTQGTQLPVGSVPGAPVQ
ncbi:MAG: lipase [Steroidobacteraceae bacterium]